MKCKWIALLLLVLAGCATPEYLCDPDECPEEIKAHSRAVNQIQKQRREGR